MKSAPARRGSTWSYFRWYLGRPRLCASDDPIPRAAPKGWARCVFNQSARRRCAISVVQFHVTPLPQCDGDTNLIIKILFNIKDHRRWGWFYWRADYSAAMACCCCAAGCRLLAGWSLINQRSDMALPSNERPQFWILPFCSCCLVIGSLFTRGAGPGFSFGRSAHAALNDVWLQIARLCLAFSVHHGY